MLHEPPVYRNCGCWIRKCAWPGEEVQPAEGMVATACLVADEPLVVTVTGGESRLTVQPSAASAW